MSLSQWFRDYLYIPLGGNRSGRLGTCRNILIVFWSRACGTVRHGPSLCGASITEFWWRRNIWRGFINGMTGALRCPGGSSRCC